MSDPEHAPLKPAALTVHEFSLVVGISRATVFRRIRDVTLSSIKIGSIRLIHFSEVERLMKGE